MHESDWGRAVFILYDTLDEPSHIIGQASGLWALEGLIAALIWEGLQ